MSSSSSSRRSQAGTNSESESRCTNSPTFVFFKGAVDMIVNTIFYVVDLALRCSLVATFATEVCMEDGTMAHPHWTLWTLFLIVVPGYFIAIYNIMRQWKWMGGTRWAQLALVISNLVLLGPALNRLQYVVKSWRILHQDKTKRSKQRVDMQMEETRLWNLIVMSKLIQAICASYPQALFQVYLAVREKQVTYLKFLTIASSLATFVHSFTESELYVLSRIYEMSGRKYFGAALGHRLLTKMMWLTLVLSSALSLPLFAAYTWKGELLALFLLIVYPLFFVDHNGYTMTIFVLHRYLFFHQDENEESSRFQLFSKFGQKLKKELEKRVFQCKGLSLHERNVWMYSGSIAGLVSSAVTIFLAYYGCFAANDELDHSESCDNNTAAAFNATANATVAFAATNATVGATVATLFPANGTFATDVDPTVLSNIFSRVFFRVDSNRRDFFLGTLFTALAFAILWQLRVRQHLPPVLRKRERQKKVVLIGDDGVGKSAALHVYESGRYVTMDRTCAERPVEVRREFFGVDFDFVVEDLPGGSPPQKLKDPDVIVVFFDVSNRTSFLNARNLYCPQTRDFFPSAKLLVVGAMTDKRDLKNFFDDFVGQAEVDAEISGADNDDDNIAYVECSSRELKGVDEAFETAFRMAIGDSCLRFKRMLKMF